jgi:hypothetical protein
MPDAPQTGSDGTGVSTATTVFLFGDLFAARVDAGKRGTRAFASGAVVGTEALAQMMLAVTFQHLQTVGIARLSHFSEKRLGVLSTSGVRLILGADLDGRGVIGRVARVLDRERKLRDEGVPVERIVRRAMQSSRNPYGEVIQWGIDEAVERGYLERAKQGGVLGFGAKRSVNADADRMAILAAPARALADGWIAFRKTDPELAKELRVVIGKGIEEAKRETGWDDD